MKERKLCHKCDRLAICPHPNKRGCQVYKDKLVISFKTKLTGAID